MSNFIKEILNFTQIFGNILNLINFNKKIQIRNYFALLQLNFIFIKIRTIDLKKI